MSCVWIVPFVYSYGQLELEYPNKVHKITDMSKRNGSGDHFVKLTCKDIDDADKTGQDMLQRHSNFIRSITINPLWN